LVTVHIAQYRDGWRNWRRVTVDKIFVFRRKSDSVVSIFWCEQFKVGTINFDAVIVPVIRVSLFFSPCGKVYFSLLLIHIPYLLHGPLALGNAILDFSRFYIQYAHARICSIFRTATKQGINLRDAVDVDLSPLKNEEEFLMIKKILSFTEIIEKSAELLEVHRVAFYLQDLVGTFHSTILAIALSAMTMLCLLRVCF